MTSGRGDAQLERASGANHPRVPDSPGDLEGFDAYVSIHALSIGDDPTTQFPHGRGKVGCAGIVGGSQQEAIGGHGLGEGRIRRLDVGVVAVEVEVIRLDIGDDGDIRPISQEGTVRLVGLGNENRAGATQGVAIQVHQFRTDHERWVRSGRPQRRHEHCRGGRLAIGPRDGDSRIRTHRARERLGAVQHPHPLGARRDQFGVGLGDCRGDDEGVDVAQVPRIMSDANRDPGRLQSLHSRRGGTIAATDRHPLIVQELCHPRHTAATDGQEVH